MTASHQRTEDDPFDLRPTRTSDVAHNTAVESEPDDHLDPERLELKVESLRAVMETAGWQGLPLLVVQGTNRAWNGSHRIAAARLAAISVPVVWSR